MLRLLMLITLISTTVITITFSLIDSFKERIKKSNPFISFIVPSYNDGKTVESTIKGIYNSYPPARFELFVINDNSKDDTSKVLNTLRKKLKFNIIQHKQNQGKAKSVNKTYKQTKGDLIFIVDSDIVINKGAVDNIIARFDEDKKVGGVCCRYKIGKNTGPFTVMQDIEHNMFAFMQSAYNMFSVTALCGGCMVFKKKAFEDINMLTVNYFAEDMDAALKLQERGWKAKLSNYSVTWIAPINNIKEWYHQKMRWGAGFMQCLLAHYKVYFKNPLAILLSVSYTFLAILFLVRIFTLDYSAIGDSLDYSSKDLLWNIWQWVIVNNILLLRNVLLFFIYPICSLTYFIYDSDYRPPHKWLWVLPYTIIYYPILTIINIFGFALGIKKYRALSKGTRGW